MLASEAQVQVMPVDDHAKLRYGMAILLDLEPDIQVFSEASDL